MHMYRHMFDGIPVFTGDILCTRDGVEGSLFGALWRVLGKLAPGEVDHCLIYTGPGGRCVESAARGVRSFEMPGESWQSTPLAAERLLLDELVGVAYPLANRDLSFAEEMHIRAGVVAYCLTQVRDAKPYNVNFFNPESDGAFYCSQLVYKAYLAHGIDLHIEDGTRSNSLVDRIVFPQEIWDVCASHHAVVKVN